MDNLAVGPTERDGHHESATNARRRRLGWGRASYLVASVFLIALYPILQDAGRNAIYQVASLGAIVAVLVQVRMNRSHRPFWLLLLVALVVIEIASLLSVLARGTAVAVNGPVDGVGNLLFLTAALVLVTRRARNNLGSIVDTSIFALALGGVLWDLALGPNLLPDYQTGPAQLALCLVVIALSGVLGALGQLVTHGAVGALRPLVVALTVGFAGTAIVAVTTDQGLITIAGMMFVGSYTAIGLFSLNPATSLLFTAAPRQPDTLSVRRLVFLGMAVAVVPVVVGIRQLTGATGGGLVLVVSGATIATLVMVRIGQLSAQRDRAEQALRYDATHDALTGLVNRKEFVRQLGIGLARREPAAVLFCDLDRFKAVNDGFGHDHGDEVLVEVAQRLRQCVRTDDVISRFGGDEFVILLRRTKPEEIHAINQRIIEALERPVSIAKESVTFGVTTGVAQTIDETEPERLINRADQAMYARKARSR